MISCVLLGLCLMSSMASATTITLGNLNGQNFGCFNSFGTNSDNAFDACLAGLVGAVILAIGVVPLFASNNAASYGYGYSNNFRRQDTSPVDFKNPFETAAQAGTTISNRISGMFNKIRHFWKSTLQRNGLIERRQKEAPYPYQANFAYQPQEQQQQQQQGLQEQELLQGGPVEHHSQ